MRSIDDATPTRYCLLGRIWSADEEGFESALAQVHSSAGSAQRPRCLCMPGGVDMVVARLSKQFILKRMPQTGAKHHASCISYEPDQEATGLGELMGDAVVDVDGDGTKVDVRVNFAMSRTSGKPGVRATAGKSEVVQPKSACLSLRALLHLLFNRAGFDRWSPAMAGKRSQWVIQKYLMQAASSVFVKGMPVAERLYVPEQFSQMNRMEVAMRRRQKLTTLYPRDGVWPLGLLIGEFKSSDVVSGVRRVWIKHMPDAPLMIREATWKRMEKTFGKLFEAKLGEDQAQIRLVMAALIKARTEQNFEIDSATLMMTTAHWIPIDEVFELTLIQAMVDAERRFWKPLRFDAGADRIFPNALLLDMGSLPVPVFGLSPFMNPNRIEHVKNTANKAKLKFDQVQILDLSKYDALSLERLLKMES